MSATAALGDGPTLQRGVDNHCQVVKLPVETVFSLTELPARLVVVGGGPLGCELAQAFSRPATLLADDEPEAVGLIRARR